MKENLCFQNFIVSIFYIIISIVLFEGNYCHAQQLTFKGTIKDSGNTNISNANVIGFSLQQEDVKFSISDQEGRYKLILQKNNLYRIEVTYLGYKKIIDTINISQNTQKDFVLEKELESLDEVVLKQRIPVIVKEDTLTYRAEAFTDGKEKKLKEVLEKLPGVDVDRSGNVKVNGKDVTKLLVDGRPFFTGDEKLGVNNIPANVVDEIVAIDDYNEVAFLKGLNDNQQVALNIKLKKGKKNFVFGDAEAGGGIKERYIVHPTLFYYSPKNAVNFIGDFNNIGERSFKFSDYLNFEGGINSLSEGVSVRSLLQDDFSSFLNDSNFIFNKNIFGAASISKQISTYMTLDAYTIANQGVLEKREESKFLYLFDSFVNEENRTITEANDLFFTINKLKLKYAPKKETDFRYEFILKTSNGIRNTSQNSFTQDQNIFVNTSVKPTAVDLNQNVVYSKKISDKSTVQVNANYEYKQQDNQKDWFFNQPIFSSLIPLIDQGDSFRLLQNRYQKDQLGSIQGKYFFKLNKKNHLYPLVGFKISDQFFETIDEQYDRGNSLNDFENAGFNNKVNFRLHDSYLGFEYKSMPAKKLEVTSKVIYHYYYWFSDQKDASRKENTRQLLLPSIKANYNFTNTRKLGIRSGLRSQFYDISNYGDRFVLSNFNQVFRGNRDLENELNFYTNMMYNSFSLYSGTLINLNATYTHTLQSARSATAVENISQINELLFNDLPENNYNFIGAFSKKFSKVKLGTSSSFIYSNYKRFINNEINSYENLNYSYSVSGKTRFKKAPNIELGVRRTHSNFSSDLISNQFIQTDYFSNLSYSFLDSFLFEGTYSFNNYQNESLNQTADFQIANASLIYNKENSLYSFGLKASNLLNIKFNNNNSFSQFLISDSRTFVQPRTIIFTFTYKL